MSNPQRCHPAIGEEKPHNKKDYDRLKKRLYHRLEQFLLSDHQNKDCKRFIKRLKRHKMELFTFLQYENVSHYNNHAEQQMRKPVQTRKVSYQNRSKQGAETQAILMTLFRSSELQGENPVEHVLSITKNIMKMKTPPDNYFKMAA